MWEGNGDNPMMKMMINIIDNYSIYQENNNNQQRQ